MRSQNCKPCGNRAEDGYLESQHQSDGSLHIITSLSQFQGRMVITYFDDGWVVKSGGSG